ncbi:MAG: hypothetical protein D6722_08930 [Bacteroidetes bacterium]|nr:MAG: hypothetical protein D6722_08930 [Bacteroidota bacterium]
MNRNPSLCAAELETFIIESVQSCQGAEGWANLARVGTELRARGVNYGKLRRFFADYDHLVELRLDMNIDPPVAYVRLRQEQ